MKIRIGILFLSLYNGEEEDNLRLQQRLLVAARAVKSNKALPCSTLFVLTGSLIERHF